MWGRLALCPRRKTCPRKEKLVKGRVITLKRPEVSLRRRSFTARGKRTAENHSLILEKRMHWGVMLRKGKTRIGNLARRSCKEEGMWERKGIIISQREDGVLREGRSTKVDLRKRNEGNESGVC